MPHSGHQSKKKKKLSLCHAVTLCLKDNHLDLPKIPEVKGPSEKFPWLKKKNSKPDIICFFSSRSVVFVAPNKSALFHIFLIFDIRVKVRIFSDVFQNIV